MTHAQRREQGNVYILYGKVAKVGLEGHRSGFPRRQGSCLYG